ncbi:MAG: electron transport complex subunit RsxC [Spirochaetes bacterium]|nr:MAG: electron transport complex subunit RsxC [Spirochaetota bacterium]
MRRLKTFPKGGVHPPGNKHLTSGKAIINAAIPSISRIPLQQHIGSPAECLINPGENVKEGMLIGRSTGFISAQIHSSIPGVVKEVRDIYLANGFKSKGVVIEMEGEFDTLGKRQEKNNWEKLSAEELLNIIADRGIVGMGGATFPTHVKYKIPKHAKVEAFVVNGTECEPYLTADHRLMLEKTEEIMEGARIVDKILNPEKIYIAIEANKLDAIEVMQKAVSLLNKHAEVVPLEIKYPQGDEKQLLKAIINREVPSGGLPIDIGAVVSNVGTIFAIYEAVVMGKPLIERIVTVTGGAIKNPQNLKVRIGTPIGDLIEECGGFSEMPVKVVAGGPMMGFAIYELEAPVTKGTSGVIALTKKEVKSNNQTPCLNCGRCITVCPMGLNPTLLFKEIDHMDYDSAMEEGLMDCKECGCCAFMCPAHIPLVHGMKLGKYMAKKKKEKG